MSKIIGTENTSFKGSDGTQVEGLTVYTSEAIDPKRGQGERGDRFFMSKARLTSLDFKPAVGMHIEVLYNKYGKVSTLRLIQDPEDDSEFEIS